MCSIEIPTEGRTMLLRKGLYPPRMGNFSNKTKGAQMYFEIPSTAILIFFFCIRRMCPKLKEKITNPFKFWFCYYNR